MDDKDKLESENKKEFNAAVRMSGVVTGLTGGVIIGMVCLALYSSSPDNNLWLAGGAALGFLAAAGSLVEIVRSAKDYSQEDNGPDDKPKFEL